MSCFLLGLVCVCHLVDSLFDFVVNVAHTADPRPIDFLHDVSADRRVVLLFTLRRCVVMTLETNGRFTRDRAIQTINSNALRLLSA